MYGSKLKQQLFSSMYLLLSHKRSAQGANSRATAKKGLCVLVCIVNGQFYEMSHQKKVTFFTLTFFPMYFALAFRYSRVHISSDTAFLKILKKPFTVPSRPK